MDNFGGAIFGPIGALLWEAAKLGLDQYRHVYRRRPGSVIAFSVVTAVVIVVASIWGIGVIQTQVRIAEEKRLASLDVQQQLDQLDEVQKELEGLMGFVSDQRTKITQTQELIGQLEQERSELEPVVTADRKVVEAVLSAQKKAEARDRWKDIGIGFGVGLLTEMIVGIVLGPLLTPRLQGALTRLRARAQARAAADEAADKGQTPEA